MFTMSLEKNDYKQWRNREHSAKGVWVAKLITSTGVEGRKLTCVPWEGVFWLNSGVLWAHKLKSTHLMDSFFLYSEWGGGEHIVIICSLSNVQWRMCFVVIAGLLRWRLLEECYYHIAGIQSFFLNRFLFLKRRN